MNSTSLHIQNFLGYMANVRGSGENTISAYGRDLRMLEEYMDTPIEDATTTALMAYVFRLHKNGKHPSTISRKIAVIKNFYRYLYYERLIPEDPAAHLKHPRFSRDEQGGALSEIDKIKIRSTNLRPGLCAKDVRDRTIAALICSTGIKASEIISLNLDSYDTATHCLKQHEDESMKTLLDYDIAELMNAYVNNYRGQILRNKQTFQDALGEPLFLNMKGQRLTRQGIWKIVREYGRQLELSAEISPRTLETDYKN